MINQWKIGVVGCGNISDIYLENLMTRFKTVVVDAVCDTNRDKALRLAEKYGISHVFSFDELLNNKDCNLILVLTNPNSHYELVKKVLLAGKHVYVEKPLALTYREAKELVDLSDKLGCMLGVAPDTILGASIQTVRKYIDSGLIGNITSASVCMATHGAESWHPDPSFLYQKGGGPVFDLAPYSLTALVSLLGSVESVTSMSSSAYSFREISNGSKRGEKIKVEVPTHMAGILHFQNGAITTLISSFDIWGSQIPPIEIHGTIGSFVLPSPGSFGGDVLYHSHISSYFEKLPICFPFSNNSRGLGICDMVKSYENHEAYRTNGRMACHIVEIMEALHKSAQMKKEVYLKSCCERPNPFYLGIQESDF